MTGRAVYQLISHTAQVPKLLSCHRKSSRESALCRRCELVIVPVDDVFNGVLRACLICQVTQGFLEVHVHTVMWRQFKHQMSDIHVVLVTFVARGRECLIVDLTLSRCRSDHHPALSVTGERIHCTHHLQSPRPQRVGPVSYAVMKG
jgi:hypothetical protein